MSSEIKLIPRGVFTKSILAPLYKEQLRVLKVLSKKIVTKPLSKPVRLVVYSSKKQFKKEMGFSGNAFADQKTNSIYAFIPPKGRVLGFHEMVHIVAKPLGKAPLFYVEGLAMYFDKTWHGQSLKQIVKHDYTSAHGIHAVHILSNEHFRMLPQKYAYAFSGLACQKLVKMKGLATLLHAYQSSKRAYSYQRNTKIFKELFSRSPQNFFESLLGESIKVRHKK